MDLSRFGSDLLTPSETLRCALCGGGVAYVRLPGNDLAAECQSCGKATALDAIGQAETLTAIVPSAPAPFVSVVPADDLGLEWIASVDGYHIGIFEREHEAWLAAGNWATAIRIGITTEAQLATWAPRINRKNCGGAHHIQSCPEEVRGVLAERRCACGAPATLLVHCNGEHPCCEECYQRQFEDNYEEWRGWEVEPLPLAA